jgi:hypothetical protein
MDIGYMMGLVDLSKNIQNKIHEDKSKVVTEIRQEQTRTNASIKKLIASSNVIEFKSLNR